MTKKLTDEQKIAKKAAKDAAKDLERAANAAAKASKSNKVAEAAAKAVESKLPTLEDNKAQAARRNKLASATVVINPSPVVELVGKKPKARPVVVKPAPVVERVVTVDLKPVATKTGEAVKAEIASARVKLNEQRVAGPTVVRQRLSPTRVVRAPGESPSYGTVSTMNAIKDLYFVAGLSNGAAYSAEEIATKLGKSLSTVRTNITYMAKANSPIGPVPIRRGPDGKYGIVR